MKFKKPEQIEAYEPMEDNYEIRLNANESFFNLPDWFIEELTEELKTLNFNRYPDPFARKVADTYGNIIGVDGRYITAGNGSDELISIIINSFLQKGEKIVVTSPEFSMYEFYARLAEIECVCANKKPDLSIGVDEIIDAAKKSEAKAVILSNPCNPTGQGIAADEIIRMIRSVNSLVVLDEAYMDFWNQGIVERVLEFDNLIVLKTCSKAYGLAGIRLGFAVANAELTCALRKCKSPYNVNSVTQAIGLKVLSHPDYLRECTEKIIIQKQELEKKLSAQKFKKLGEVVPTVTNFVLFKTKQASEINKNLLEHGVSVRALGEYLRITAGSEYENNMLIKIMGEIICVTE